MQEMLRGEFRKVPWREEWQLTPEVLPGEYHGPGSLLGCSGGHKDWDTGRQLSTHSTGCHGALLSPWSCLCRGLHSELSVVSAWGKRKNVYLESKQDGVSGITSFLFFLDIFLRQGGGGVVLTLKGLLILSILIRLENSEVQTKLRSHSIRLHLL